MRQGLIKKFICPQCKGSNLKLIVLKETPREVHEGEIQCLKCNRRYPIYDGIAQFLDVAIEPGHSLNKTLQRIAGESDMVKKVLKANIVYHNAVANAYETDGSADAVFTQQCQKRIEEAVASMYKNTGGQLLVDFGCGTGNVLAFAKEKFEQVIGIDVSLGMLKVAKKKGMEVALGNIYQTHLKSDTVDAVSCFSVLHHTYNPMLPLQEAYRILTPGGLLYTDLDPNEQFRTYIDSGCLPLIKYLYESYIQNIALSGIRRLFRGILSLQGRIQDISSADTTKPYFQMSSPTMKKLANMAEYHYDRFTKGIDPLYIQEQLLKMGFTDVKIIYHWNGDSIFTDTTKVLSVKRRVILYLQALLAGKLDRRRLAPLFAILARK